MSEVESYGTATVSRRDWWWLKRIISQGAATHGLKHPRRRRSTRSSTHASSRNHKSSHL